MPAVAKHSGADEAERELEGLLDALTDLSPTDADVRASVIRHNEGVNFDPMHRLSILTVDSGRGEVGSLAGSYGDLLDVDPEAIGDIIDEHLQGGIDG